jgi:hypothetical protein
VNGRVTLKPGVQDLNVRRGPGKEYEPPLPLMKAGDVGEVRGRSEDGKWLWLHGPNGWVSAAYLVPAPAGAPAKPSPGGKGWRLAKSLGRFTEQLNALAPRRTKTHDGTIGDARHRGLGNKTDHNPNRDGVVTAGDYTHDPSRGADMHKIAEALRKAQDPRLKYVIFSGRMFSSYPARGVPAWAWREYDGANKHLLHMHLSVVADTALYDDARDWMLP